MNDLKRELTELMNSKLGYAEMNRIEPSGTSASVIASSAASIREGTSVVPTVIFAEAFMVPEIALVA